MSNSPPSNGTADFYPPSKVRDLRARVEGGHAAASVVVVRLEFTSPGDDYDEGTGERERERDAVPLTPVAPPPPPNPDGTFRA